MAEEKLKTYRELEVWQASIELVVMIYKLSKHLSDDVKFGLTCQMRRAATSIPANIAEGYGRIHKGDYLRFLFYANGSLMELETHIIVAVKTDMINRDQPREVWQLTRRVGQMLAKLMKSLQR